MIITNDCIPCMLTQVQKTCRLVNLPSDQTERITRKVLQYLSRADWSEPPPGLAKNLYALLHKEIGNDDPYKMVKDQYNTLILELIDDLERIVQDSPDQFITALKLAISGNIIDFGTNHEISREIILDQIRAIEKKPIELDHSEKLRSSLKNAKSLLYLGDNCGEIVFDRVFISYLQKNYPDLKIRFAVRGAPIINDVTSCDAKQTGLDKLVEVVENGDSTPGTILKYTSDYFRELFYQSDLIISKGQGNYETLNNIDRQGVYLLFMAKCEPVASSLDVPRMSLVCVER